MSTKNRWQDRQIPRHAAPALSPDFAALKRANGLLGLALAMLAAAVLILTLAP